MSDSPLIFAKQLDGLGGALPHLTLEEAKSSDQPVWFHFDANHPEARNLITASFPDVDEYSVHAIFAQDARPQKDAITQLLNGESEWLSSKNFRRIQEAQDILLRGIEELDSIRERSQVVKDELVNALSDRLNRNLYVLSVITAIFLPLGFLTGLFGINIGGLPGVNNASAFQTFSVSLVILVGVQIILFKIFKWF